MRAPALLPVFLPALQAPLLLRMLNGDEPRPSPTPRVLVVGAPDREAVNDAAWEQGRALVEKLVRTGMLVQSPRNLEVAAMARRHRGDSSCTSATLIRPDTVIAHDGLSVPPPT